MIERIEIVDSHTAGEPTRVVMAGGPDLGSGPLASRRDLFRERFDRYRRAIVNEPRGSDVIVGAMLLPPQDRSCVAGVIFFNNVGFIGMCGHGTIGVVTTLAHAGRIAPGTHRIETPVGVVTTVMHDSGEVSVVNVPSFRSHAGVSVTVDAVGTLDGDVAYGGNWFYLVRDADSDLALEHVGLLTARCLRIREALRAKGFAHVDHVELFGNARGTHANARNFVLCPGGAYDRSPCGTGTSAKLACMAADGALAEGETWVQESITGTTFSAWYRWLDRVKGTVEPTISGRAYITAESTQLLDPDDPFCWGIG